MIFHVVKDKGKKRKELVGLPFMPIIMERKNKRRFCSDLIGMSLSAARLPDSIHVCPLLNSRIAF